MTAIAADREAKSFDEGLVAYPVAAATTLYAGTAIGVNAAGYAVALTDSAALKFVGICNSQVRNTTAEGFGSAGDLDVQVHTRGIFAMVSAGLAITDQMVDLYWADNQTVQVAPTEQYAGKLVRFTSATEALVDISAAIPQPDSESADERRSLGVAANKVIAANDLVAMDADGYLVAANDVTAVKFVGQALEAADNTGGANGDIDCFVARDGVRSFTAAGLAEADVGKEVFVSTATNVTLVPGRMSAGILAEFSSATVAVVDIGGASQVPMGKQFGVAANKVITAGELIGGDADGYALRANDADCVAFAGVAMDSQDNTGGADGDLSVTLKQQGRIRMTAAGLTDDDVGKPLYVSDVTTVSLTPGDVYAGKLEQFTAATHGNLLMDDATDEPYDIDVGGSRGRMFIIHGYYGAAPGGGAVNMRTDMEFPRKYRVISAFANAETAPGGAVVCTISLTDGTTNYDVTITGAAVAGENKTPGTTAMLANFDTDITCTEGGGGAGDGYSVDFICEEL